MRAYLPLIEIALAEIFQPEREQMQRTLEGLVRENQSRGGTMNAFRYEGLLYSVIPLKHVIHDRPRDLDPTLEKSFLRYQKRMDRFERDFKKIRQAISMVVSKCRSQQQLRDALPDSITHLVPGLKDLPRHDIEGCVLKDKPHLHRQFTEAMDIALDYIANRLIYS